MPNITPTDLANAAIASAIAGQVLIATGAGVASATSVLNTVVLIDRGGAVFNAKHEDFGAVANGTTDDLAAINATLAAAATVKGIAYLPQGSYYLSGPVSVPSHTSLIGAGRGKTVLINGGGDSCVEMSGASYASVERLTIDVRTSGGGNGVAIYPDGSGNPSMCCSVMECEILGKDIHQYLIYNKNANCTKILFNWIDGGVPAYVTPSGQEGIEVQGGDGVLIMGNTVRNVGNNGIDPGVSDDVNYSVKNIRIIGNHIDGAAIGIGLVSVYGPTYGTQVMDHVIIEGNDIKNCWLDGLYVNVTGNNKLTNLIVANNIFDTVGTIAEANVVFFLGDSTVVANPGNVSGAIFSHNIVRGISQDNGNGMRIVQYPGIRVLGNDFGDVAAAAGVQVSGSPDTVLLDNFVFNVRDFGIWVLGASHRTVADHNRIENCNNTGNGSAGIQFESSNYIAARNNSLNQTANDTALVSVLSNCDAARVSGNVQLYAAFQLPELNRSTNPSSGSVTGLGTFLMTAGATTTTVTNSQCRRTSIVVLTQIAGPPTAFTVAVADGSFAVAFGANAVGTEEFAFKIDP